MSTNREKVLIALLLIVSAVPRFWGLGASHFYGDETKTLYLDKTVPAAVYFLDQRKGPIQFFVTWTVEKLSGGYDEFWIRLPFAIAGLLSVLAFYLLVKKLFDIKIAFLATLLYSFSGFSVAFSRTAQYQSFLLLFGLLGLLLFLYYCDTSKRLFLILSALFYVLAFYSHYDAIFYVIPAIFILPVDKFKEIFLYFVMPIIILVSLFYVPYLYKGYFVSNTVGYLSRRLTGNPETLVNNSIFTFNVYNPFNLFLPFLIIGSLIALPKLNKNRSFMFVWFFVSFVLFTLVFKSPGTHILHYFLPIYILSAVGWLGNKFTLKIALVVVAMQISSVYYVFAYNSNYPWVASRFFPQAQKNYQLFLYGFPYNRSWTQIAEYLNSQKGARGFYTNDNTVVAKYYVKKLDVTIPATNFYPQYYVYVYNNQEFRYPNQEFLSHYSLVQKIDLDADVYKRIDSN